MKAFENIRERITEIMLVTPEDRMYAEVLDLLLGVFKSEFGYFGYINTAGDLVCPSMTRHIFPVCQVPDKDVVFPRSVWGGLWGRILTERRPMIKNETHKVPQGHLPIGRSFGCPILYRGNLIGQLHFANRDEDYTEDDIALLDQTCQFIAPILNARVKHDEQEMATTRLAAELDMSNAALRAKVGELQQLNDALVDREERMVELKRELAEARAELARRDRPGKT
ncbi:MAG: GAF domain-containing protein [Kofleriaceae bacterium]